jgi:hypothetical protein
VLPIDQWRYALAYQLRAITTTEIITAFVDAHSGELLKSESLVHGWPDQFASGPGAAGPSSSLRAYDMRGQLENTLLAVDRPGIREWMTSFAPAASDQVAARIGSAMDAAVSYVHSRLTTDPAASGTTPIALVHPQQPGFGAPLFGSAPVYATGGIIVFSDAASESPAGRAGADVAAHYIGHALAESTAGMLYTGEAAAITEGLANLVAWGAGGSNLNAAATAAIAAGVVTPAPGSALPSGIAVDRHAAYAANPLDGGRLIAAILGTALIGPGAETPRQRAAIETALLHALTWLTPTDPTLEMARAATLEGLRSLGPTGAAPLARLRTAWDRAGVR